MKACDHWKYDTDTAIPFITNNAHLIFNFKITKQKRIYLVHCAFMPCWAFASWLSVENHSAKFDSNTAGQLSTLRFKSAQTDG